MTTPAALVVRDLTLTYAGSDHPAVRDVSLSVAPGEVVALVGESGSGKSTLLRAVLGLLDTAAMQGEITVAGRTVTAGARAEARRRDLRGSLVGYVGQDPYAAMDPLASVGRNVAAAWRVKRLRPPPGEVLSRLADVGVDRAAQRTRLRPHLWSGGMLQRASVVAGSALHPALVVADEPTSALDSVNAHRVLTALRSLADAALVVSHDVALVSEFADRVLLMEGGRLRALDRTGKRATWAPRTPASGAEVLRAAGIGVDYGRHRVLADLDLTVRAGEIVGVGGASGVGKSTLLRVLAGLERPSRGQMRWHADASAPERGEVALVMQDARGSLPARWSIERAVGEPLDRRLLRRPDPDRADRIEKALARVGLADLDPARSTGSLSGGQAQRVAIARALVGRARVLLADEPTSGLDHANADRILGIIRGLADDQQWGVVIVSHDDRTLSTFADRTLMLEEVR